MTQLPHLPDTTDETLEPTSGINKKNIIIAWLVAAAVGIAVKEILARNKDNKTIDLDVEKLHATALARMEIEPKVRDATDSTIDLLEKTPENVGKKRLWIERALGRILKGK